MAGAEGHFGVDLKNELPGALRVVPPGWLDDEALANLDRLNGFLPPAVPVFLLNFAQAWSAGDCECVEDRGEPAGQGRALSARETGYFEVRCQGVICLQKTLAAQICHRSDQEIPLRFVGRDRDLQIGFHPVERDSGGLTVNDVNQHLSDRLEALRTAFIGGVA